MKAAISAAVVATLSAMPVLAQGPVSDPYMQAAIDSGVCGDADVRTAVFNEERNIIEVTCEDEPAGIFPIIGGLGPALGIGAAALGALALGGSGASGTN
ncbi:MAG: hypothetical protein H3C51_10640 [Rubellimicrobium sp.]|nr:hypothetical protein [Rubellimicrobium sp.]